MATNLAEIRRLAGALDALAEYETRVRQRGALPSPTAHTLRSIAGDLCRVADELAAPLSADLRASLMSVEEAADRLGVAGNTVRTWCHRGDLDAVLLGTTWVIRASSVADEVEARRGREAR